MIDFATLTHIDDLNGYAANVVNGDIAACQWVVLACKRHFDDLERKDIYLDEIAVNKVCWFFEQLPHTKGKWSIEGKKLVLEPWQKFVIGSAFGWKYTETNLRRFREVACFVPRKNGKSAIAAGVGLWALCDREEAGPEVYCGATSMKQALEVYRPASQMLKKLPKLCKSFGLEVMASKLTRKDGGRFEAVIGKPGDGSSPSCAIVDEYHEQQTPELYETMQTGMGAREHPLLFTITTAGWNIEGPCHELQTRAQEMLNHTIPDDQLFAVIHTIDKGDDWTDPAVLAKANPNMGVSVYRDYLESQQKRALNSSSFANTFKTKHLNQWVSSRDGFFNLEKWQDQEDENLKIEDFTGKSCWIGLDLAAKTDLCAAVFVFPEWRDNKLHYSVFPYFWCPEDLAYGEHASPPLKRKLQRFIHLGLVKTYDGAEVSFKELGEELIDLAKPFKVEEIDFDPWGGYQIARDFQDAGLMAVKIPQQVMHLSPAMKEVDSAILAGRIHHDGNPAFSWMMSNVTAKPDANENVFPRKEKADNKIDGPAALFNAINRAMVGEPEPEGVMVLEF